MIVELNTNTQVVIIYLLNSTSRTCCIFHWLRNEISRKCSLTYHRGLGPRGCFESRAQCCLSVAFLLSAIADENFRAPVPTQPFV